MNKKNDIYLNPVEFDELIKNYKESASVIQNIKMKHEVDDLSLQSVDRFCECIQEFNEIIENLGELLDNDVNHMNMIKSDWLGLDERLAGKKLFDLF